MAGKKKSLAKVKSSADVTLNLTILVPPKTVVKAVSAKDDELDVKMATEAKPSELEIVLEVWNSKAQIQWLRSDISCKEDR